MRYRVLLLLPALLVLATGITQTMRADAANVVSGPASVRFKYDLALDTPTFIVQDLVWNCAPLSPSSSAYLWLSNTGNLNGTCFYDPDPGNVHVDRISATMSGSIDFNTGAVIYNSTSTFKEARHTQTTGSVSHTVELSGTGTASGTYASGTVNFTVTSSCEPTPMCDPNLTYSYSGQVPFEMFITSFTEVDLQLGATEVVQVVQDDVGIVPMVAHRATVIRVYLKTDLEIPGVELVLTAKLGNTPLPGEATLLPGSALTPLVTPDRATTSGSFNFLLPDSWTGAGLVQVLIKAKTPPGVTESNPADNEIPVPILFEEKRRLSVGYLPVCVYTDTPDNAVCPAFGYETADSFADLIFPSPGGGVRSVQFPMPPHKWFFDPVADPWGASLNTQLRMLYDINALLSLDEVPDQLAGWIPPIGGQVPGGYSDPVWAGSTGRVSFSQFYADDPNYSSFLLAHEVAHNLGRRHTNRNDACGAVDPDSDWPDTFSSTGSYGWDIQRNVVVPPDRQDLMTYCASLLSNMWISPFTYMKLFEGNFEPRRARSDRAVGSYLVVRGNARSDSSAGEFEGSYVLQSATETEVGSLGTPTHCIRFNDNPANDFCFHVDFHDHRTHEDLDRAWFAVTAPFPVGTTKVSLMAGSTELAVLNASANAPTAAFPGFPAGATWDGEQTLAWSRNDADGGDVDSLLLYSNDGGVNWLPLSLEEQGSSFSFDTDTLRPGSVQFRVIASDGLRIGEATSPPLTVLGVSGDVTCDGTIDLGDVVGLRRDVAALGSPPVCIAAGDVNCSGLRETGDALALLRSLAGLANTLPQGCTAIGED